MAKSQERCIPPCEFLLGRSFCADKRRNHIREMTNVTWGAQMYPTLPCPLIFAEEVGVRAGQPSNAQVLASAARAAARAQGSDGDGDGDGSGKLASLMEVLPVRFRSWQRPPAHLGLQHTY